jgi:hypothetical protein
MARSTIPVNSAPEVSEVANGMSKRLQANLTKNPEATCADYGDAGAASGLLRRY